MIWIVIDSWIWSKFCWKKNILCVYGVQRRLIITSNRIISYQYYDPKKTTKGALKCNVDASMRAAICDSGGHFVCARTSFKAGNIPAAEEI